MFIQNKLTFKGMINIGKDEKKLSDEDIYKSLGISESTYYRYIKYPLGMKVETLIALAKLVGVSQESLLFLAQQKDE